MTIFSGEAQSGLPSQLYLLGEHLRVLRPKASAGVQQGLYKIVKMSPALGVLQLGGALKDSNERFLRALKTFVRNT